MEISRRRWLAGKAQTPKRSDTYELSSGDRVGAELQEAIDDDRVERDLEVLPLTMVMHQYLDEQRDLEDLEASQKFADLPDLRGIEAPGARSSERKPWVKGRRSR